MFSGFSFLSAKAPTNSVEPVPEGALSVLTVTAKLNGEQSDGNEISLLGAPILADDNIKLFKSSEPKLVKKKRRGPKVGFARGEESVDDESESLHSSAMKESAATATTESLSPHTADEDGSAPNLQSNASISDSIMKDSLKPVPTSQPSQSVPLADVPTEKLSTSSSSFMFDGMSVSAAKMQNPEEKESSLTKSISKETPEAVNKSDAASSVREQKKVDGATGSTSNRRDDPTTDPLAQQSRSTTTPLAPAAAAVVVSVTAPVTAPAIATVAASTSTSSANRISGIDIDEEAVSVIHKSVLPSLQEKEHGGGGEKESKKPPRSSASSMEVASSKQRRAALQPAYEKRGMKLCSEFETEMSRLMMLQTDAARERSEQRRELLSIEKWLAEAEDRILAMEEQQLRLAAAEEFELADALSGDLEGLQEEMRSRNNRRKLLQGQSAAWNPGPGAKAIDNSEHTGIEELQATAITDLVRSLTLTAEQEDRRVKEAFIFEEEQTAAESLRLSCEVERISVEEAYTCEEEKTLSEQAGEMESAIAVQAGSAMDKKTSIEAQRAAVADEMKELERQLAEKKTKFEDLVVELEIVNEKIGTVRTAYQRQIQRIEDRRALLSSTRVSWQADQASLIEWQSSHEDSVRKIMQERESSTLWRSNVTRDVQVLTATRDMIISTQAASHSALSPSSASTPSPHSPEMLLFLAAREQLDAVQESLSALLISQMHVNAMTNSLEGELQEVKELCVKMEAEKKSHAAARRFKEAALVAKDEKPLLKQREDLSQRIEENKALQAEKAAEVSLLQAKKAAVACEVRTAKELSDTSRHCSLKQQMLILELFHSSLTHANTNSRSKSRSKSRSESDSKSKDNGEAGLSPVDAVDETDSSGEEVVSSHGPSPFAQLSSVVIDSKIKELQLEIEDLESMYPDLIRTTGGPSAANDLTDSIEEVSSTLEGTEEASDERLTNSSDDHINGDRETSHSAADSMNKSSSPDNDGLTTDDANGDNNHKIENTTESDPGSALIDAGDDDDEDTVDRAELLEQAKGLIGSLSALEIGVTDATEEEDYELADRIDGQITQTKAELSRLLGALGLTVDEVIDVKEDDVGAVDEES